MQTTVLASTLRANIYKMLDHVIETGQPILVKRGDRAVRILPVERPSRLKQLPRRRIVSGHAESLVSVDWSKNWKPGRL
ncbi:MAG: type II toxin-antitoxin system Phd/YefM family antitoxin [Vicinamibacteria bacterium]